MINHVIWYHIIVKKIAVKEQQDYSTPIIAAELQRKDPNHLFRPNRYIPGDNNSLIDPK
jgi:hypothetical protein